MERGQNWVLFRTLGTALHCFTIHIHPTVVYFKNRKALSSRQNRSFLRNFGFEYLPACKTFQRMRTVGMAFPWFYTAEPRDGMNQVLVVADIQEGSLSHKWPESPNAPYSRPPHHATFPFGVKTYFA